VNINTFECHWCDQRSILYYFDWGATFVPRRMNVCIKLVCIRC
jgi:hypothetical protein